MAFKPNSTQQINFDDAFLNLSHRTQQIVQKSWACKFSEIVFTAINEERFSVLYSDNSASRPNTPVNAIIGAMILKEMFSLEDEQLLESILCDVRFQVALRTTSFKEQPFSDRTFSRFRERLCLHEIETGQDLLKEEMHSLAKVLQEYLEIETTVKRMDSLMVAANIRKMSRLELMYTCVANMVITVHRTGETLLLKGLEEYLKDEHTNQYLYHNKEKDLHTKLQEVINQGAHLLETLPAEYQEFEVYQQLQRVMQDQTIPGTNNQPVAKPKEDISPQSLQNPSDSDATYRKKSGKDHTGYVANIVETTNGKDSLITAYDYQVNSFSDSEFCKKAIEEMGPQKEKTILVADGAYASTENEAKAKEYNFELVSTALTGKIPHEIMAQFQLDEEKKEVLQCPAGNVPIKSRYQPSSGMYRANYPKEVCENCPHKNQCGVKFQKKSAVVMISPKTVTRAAHRQKMSTDEYRQLAKIRNGVEGIPSILRRKYDVDHIPAKGLLRSKMYFGFKIGAINVKRALKRALQAEKAACFFGNIATFLMRLLPKSASLSFAS